VALQNGGIVKGEILVMEPGEKVVIQVPGEDQGTVATAYGVIVGVQTNTLCQAPCDKVVDATPDTSYTISGDDMPTSPVFELHRYEGDVTATVDPGSTSMRGGGIAGLAVGGAFLLGGILTTVIAFTGDATDPGSVDPWVKPLGIGLIAGGAAIMVTGGVLLGLSRTSVEVEQTSRGQRARAPNYWRGEF
jgi:hypothetical protein